MSKSIVKLLIAYKKPMAYAFLSGLLGGIASFIGSPYHGLIKAMIGTTVGFALCGHWFHPALRNLLKASEEVLEGSERASE